MNNRNWTLQNVPNLAGKVMIVTGGNSGLGFETVKAFAMNNAEVILACRDLEKGKKAKKRIITQYPDSKITIMQLDLADQSSVKAFAYNVKESHSKIDVLVNNAGIMMTPYFKTKDGFEGQFGTNHLGHFALTGHLLKELLNASGSRIVNVSSLAHRRGEMDFDNLQFENGKDFGRIKAYGRSKLANLLFTYELQRKLETYNKDTIAVAAHPGIALTNLASGVLINSFLFTLLSPIMRLFLQSAAKGALPQIRAAVDPKVLGGQYYGPNGSGEKKGYPIQVQSNEASKNIVDSSKLWEYSQNATDVTYDFN